MKPNIFVSRSARSNSWHSSLKAGRRWYELYLRMIHIIVGSVPKSGFASCVIFIRQCYMIKRAQGIPGLCKRLKASNVLLMQYLAGEPHRNSRELGVAISRTRSGIPRSIPIHHRRKIEDGDVVIVRLYLSFYSLYRVLDWKGKLDLSTITLGSTVPWDPLLYADWLKFIPTFFSMLRAIGGVDWDAYGKGRLDKFKEEFPLCFLPLIKSAPGTSGDATSMWALDLHAFAWKDELHTYAHQSLLEFCILTDTYWVPQAIEFLNTMGQRFLKLSGWLHPRFARWRVTSLGKLAIKEEPGKVRVFAMVDYFTQVVMAPLHKFLFMVLESIPQDGTMDQSRPLDLLVNNLKTLKAASGVDTPEGHLKARNYLNTLGTAWKGAKVGRCYSFDLSAATDRLPVAYQKPILNSLAPRLGDLWADILVGRAYHLSDRMLERLPEDHSSTVYYSVGQPMGALSSWAMLALTHHMIIQFCAYRIGYEGWFPYYAVLGDDVVIANDNVAREYLSIVTRLGVKISIAKTLVGQDLSLEFAKRFILNGTDVSPLSAKEFITSVSHASALLGFVLKGMRLVPLRLADVAKAAGWRHRGSGSVMSPFSTLGKRLQGLLLLLTHPSGPFGSGTVMSWLLSDSVTTVKVVTDETLWKLVQSFEDTFAFSLDKAFRSLQRKVIDLSKLPGEIWLPRQKGKEQKLDHWLFGDFGWENVKGSPRKLLLTLGEYVRTEILFKIQEELIVKLDDLEQYIYWSAQYYRASETVSPKTPAERLDFLIGIGASLEDRIASSPALLSLWRKPPEGETPPSSSRSLLRWRRVEGLVKSDKESTVEVRPLQLQALNSTLSLAKRVTVEGDTQTQ